MNKIIQQHFNLPEIQNNLNELVNKYFVSEEQKKVFWDVFELIKNGEFNVDDLYDYLDEWTDIGIEQANKFDNELFDKVYGDIYDEIKQNYEQKQKEVQIESVGEVEQEISGEEKLKQKYAQFLQSSFWQNVLSAEEGMNKEIMTDEFKNDFYEVINAGDGIKATALLRIICSAGKLGDFFKDDKRYVEFWGGVLERHNGAEEKNKFLQNTSDKKYLIEFLRFILEKRVKVEKENSAMIGVSLASLCLSSGEKEYVDMAFGDESKGEFVWSD
jgi:hypothetical protein